MKNRRGSVLVTLLIFVATGIIVTSGAVTVSLINTQGTSKFSQGEAALVVADSGAEEALLRVLRDPNFTTTNTPLSVGEETATINVSGNSSKTVQSAGMSGNNRRTVQVSGSWTSSQFVLIDWEEID